MRDFAEKISRENKIRLWHRQTRHRSPMDDITRITLRVNVIFIKIDDNEISTYRTL